MGLGSFFCCHQTEFHKEFPYNRCRIFCCCSSFIKSWCISHKIDLHAILCNQAINMYICRHIQTESRERYAYMQQERKPLQPVSNVLRCKERKTENRGKDNAKLSSTTLCFQSKNTHGAPKTFLFNI